MFIRKEKGRKSKILWTRRPNREVSYYSMEAVAAAATTRPLLQRTNDIHIVGPVDCTAGLHLELRFYFVIHILNQTPFVAQH